MQITLAIVDARRSLNKKALENQQNESALADWEDEGGSISATFCDVSGQQEAPSHPTLHSDYTAQQAWGFSDPTGRVSYELNRVYGPPICRDRRGPISQLDHDRCYWSVVWPMAWTSGSERASGAWISYADARKQRGRGISFAQFSSPSFMRQILPTIFRPEKPSDVRS